MSTLPSSLTSQPNVIIPRPDEFAKKVARMKELGAEQVQLIIDFDHTMTDYFINGERGKSSHGVVETSPLLGAAFSARTKALFEKYYPMEVSHTIDAVEKEIVMVEWWTRAHDLMMEYGLKKENIVEMVKTDCIRLREGTHDLLRTSQEHDIPVHIFSAGLYDIIHAFLDERGAGQFGAHVVSNVMTFAPDGLLTGFKGTLIHSMNKSAAAMKDSPQWNDVQTRGSVVLLGDNLTDCQMVDGLDHIDTMISVGFLNTNLDERREDFKKAYDVVIETPSPHENASMLFVNELMAALL